MLAVDRSQSMRGAPLADATASRPAHSSQRSRARTKSRSLRSASGRRPSPRFPPLRWTATARCLTLHGRLDSGDRPVRQLVAAAQLGGEPASRSRDHCSERRRRQRQPLTLTGRSRPPAPPTRAMYAIGIEGEGFTSAPLVQLSTQPAVSTSAHPRPRSLKSVYGTVGEVLRRTWRVKYVTAARPGDMIQLTAAVVGEGSARQGSPFPHTSARRRAPAPSNLFPKGSFGPSGPLVSPAGRRAPSVRRPLPPWRASGVRGSAAGSRLTPATRKATRSCSERNAVGGVHISLQCHRTYYLGTSSSGAVSPGCSSAPTSRCGRWSSSGSPSAPPLRSGLLRPCSEPR